MRSATLPREHHGRSACLQVPQLNMAQTCYGCRTKYLYLILKKLKNCMGRCQSQGLRTGHSRWGLKKGQRHKGGKGGKGAKGKWVCRGRVCRGRVCQGACLSGGVCQGASWLASIITRLAYLRWRGRYHPGYFLMVCRQSQSYVHCTLQGFYDCLGTIGEYPGWLRPPSAMDTVGNRPRVSHVTYFWKWEFVHSPHARPRRGPRGPQTTSPGPWNWYEEQWPGCALQRGQPDDLWLWSCGSLGERHVFGRASSQRSAGFCKWEMDRQINSNAIACIGYHVTNNASACRLHKICTRLELDSSIFYKFVQ